MNERKEQRQCHGQLMPFFLPYLTLASDLFTFDLLDGKHALLYVTKCHNHSTALLYVPSMSRARLWDVEGQPL